MESLTAAAARIETNLRNCYEFVLMRKAHLLPTLGNAYH
jgi:hypothetical protein